MNISHDQVKVHKRPAIPQSYLGEVSEPGIFGESDEAGIIDMSLRIDI